MALHTIKNSVEQKDKPAFLHFEKPSQEDIKPDYININLNDVMVKMSAPQFNYETFKTAYEGDPSIQEYVENFSEKGIEIGTAPEASDAPESNTDDESDTVTQMAKSATDLDDSPLG